MLKRVCYNVLFYICSLHQRSTDYSDIPEDEEPEHGDSGFNRNHSATSSIDNDVMKECSADRDGLSVQRNKNVLIAQWENKTEQSE